MSKIRYPKCPYCGEEYKDKSGDYALLNLAQYGWRTELSHTCKKCGKEYLITVKIMYYGKKKDMNK